VGRAKAETERLLNILDTVLLSRTYLVGESVTLADISVFTTLYDLFKSLLEVETRTKLFVNVGRWFDTILNQTKVKETLSKYNFEFSYCVTPVKFDPAKLKEITGKGEE
jgi:elongation factor 1-gamma